VIARTSLGDISGTQRDGIWMFRGIPYAAPPVGDRRFRAPGPAEAWTGVRDGSRFGPMAPQTVGALEGMLGARSYEQSEDCLYLNVATPAADDGRRPVMVWIHGGGFQTGAGSIPWYHGTRLAAGHDVVVVSINYRLGALGFTDLSSLGEGYAGSGNAGILDQIAALEWVRDNIAAFGGDAGNVTIFGESAGGMSVGTLLGAPGAAGLFQRAIAQSGACQASSTPDQAAAVADRLSAGFGGLAALADVPVDDLVAAQAEIAAAVRFGAGQALLPFQPVVDGVVLPEQPLAAVAGGSAADIDLVSGTTAHEFTLFTLTLPPESMSEERLRRNVARVVGDRADEVIAGYRDAQPGASTADLYVAISTDLVFRMPCEELLAAHAGSMGSGTTRSYLFTFESPAFEGRLRSSHALEIPFVFGVVDRPGNEIFLGPVDDEVVALSDACRTAWATFAATGEPAAPDVAWPLWDAGRRATAELGRTRQVLDDPGRPTRTLWAS
jgi:para-nitrobenzyl esterase